VHRRAGAHRAVPGQRPDELAAINHPGLLLIHTGPAVSTSPTAATPTRSRSLVMVMPLCERFEIDTCRHGRRFLPCWSAPEDPARGQTQPGAGLAEHLQVSAFGTARERTPASRAASRSRARPPAAGLAVDRHWPAPAGASRACAAAGPVAVAGRSASGW
jgi:hypothetical protein